MGDALNPVADGACEDDDDGQGGAEPRPTTVDHYSPVESLNVVMLAPVHDERRQYRRFIRTFPITYLNVGVKRKRRANLNRNH